MSIRALKSLDDEAQTGRIPRTVEENFVLTILMWRLWKGVCNPSVQTIANRTGMKRTTVRRALKGLQAKGRITALSKSKLGVTNWRINTPESLNLAQQQTRSPTVPGTEIKPGPLGEQTRSPPVPGPGPLRYPNRNIGLINTGELEKVSGKTAPGKSLAAMMAEAGLPPIPGILSAPKERLPGHQEGSPEHRGRQSLPT